MKTKHTPAPWTIDTRLFDEEKGPICIDGEDDQQIVCQVHGETTESVRANARLIAAAPELLEALKGLYEHCAMIHKTWGDGNNQKQADEAIEVGKKAIAKAEGGRGMSIEDWHELVAKNIRAEGTKK